jgi:hypothetical protein
MVMPGISHGARIGIASIVSIVFALVYFIAPAFAATQDCQPTIASQYAPGIMEWVIRQRQSNQTAYPLPQRLPAVDGYIAVRDCEQIGALWKVIYNKRAETFLVADCAGNATTRQWMERNNIQIEVDYITAVRWNVVGRGPVVTVCRAVAAASVSPR